MTTTDFHVYVEKHPMGVPVVVLDSKEVNITLSVEKAKELAGALLEAVGIAFQIDPRSPHPIHETKKENDDG